MAETTCSVDDCNRPTVARGWCNRHYRQWRTPFVKHRAVAACRQGHPWTDETTAFTSRGDRFCRVCRRATQARARARARVAKPPKPTWQERFWSRVEKMPDGGCWMWTGYLNHARGGYGQAVVANRRTRRAHVVAYEILVGPVPEGLVLDHLCRVRACVNPAHLEPVTIAVNNWRGEGPTFLTAKTNICRRGHEMTAANTYVQPSTGGRSCRKCKDNCPSMRARRAKRS